ncbi:MAG: TolC family protein [Nitrospirota bacterium]
MKRLLIRLIFLVALFLFRTVESPAEDLALQNLIEEALKNNPEVLIAESRWKTSTFKIPQAKSLPDPMFMFGYQNEGFRKYTFGKSEDAEWMFSASQMFPFPGKLSLKGEMASKESESMEESYSTVKLNTVARVKELYYDLFLTYKNIDLIREKKPFFRG